MNAQNPRSICKKKIYEQHVSNLCVALEAPPTYEVNQHMEQASAKTHAVISEVQSLSFFRLHGCFNDAIFDSFRRCVNFAQVRNTERLLLIQR